MEAPMGAPMGALRDALRDAMRDAMRGALFALLAFNTGAYLLTGTASEALDSLAWLALLAMFELESGRSGRFDTGRLNALVRVVRIAAAIALLAALFGYWRQREWLDVINVSLWIGVVASLELGIRRPDIVARHRRAYIAGSAALYAALIVLVLAWLLRREWFDAYDAALWLAAFALLEAGLLGRIRERRAAA